MITANQSQIIALTEEIEALRATAKEKQQELNDVMKCQQLGEIFQNPETGICYRVAEAKGQFVTFYSLEVQRTRKPGEKMGTISLTDAKEAGFSVQ